MAIIQGNAKQGSTRGFYPKVINGSLRFNDDDSAYLSWTPASAGNRKTWTWSGWVKRCTISAANSHRIFHSYDGSSSRRSQLIFNTNDTIGWDQGGSGTSGLIDTVAVFRDPSAWYHIVFVADYTNATPADRAKIYVNGVRQAVTTTDDFDNADGLINSTNAHQIGTNDSASTFADFYLANVHFIDGQALTADDFGEFKNGVWVAKDYAGTFGTNGFYLTFEDDTEVEAFNTVLYRGTAAPQSITGVGFQPDLVWIKNRNAVQHHNLFDSVRGSGKLLYSSLTNSEATSSAHLNSFDSDGFTVGSATSANGSGNGIVAWCWDAGANNAVTGHSSVTYTGNSGTQRISGFPFRPDLIWIKARNTASFYHHISDSVRGFDKYLFPNVTLAEETNTTRVISTTDDGMILGNKNDTNTAYNYVAWAWDAGDGDPVSNTDGSITSTVKASTTNGFSIVSWTGSGSTTTVGHGLSSAPDFIIIKNRTDAEVWRVYHASLGATVGLQLNATSNDVDNTNTGIFNDTEPTSSVFTVNTFNSANGTSDNMIAYCFHDVTGKQKFGTYSGTGSDVTVNTGFRVGWLMIKRTDSGDQWLIKDSSRSPFNPMSGDDLKADASTAEGGGSSTEVEFTSTGFKVTGIDGMVNASGGTYIYAAFAGSYSDYITDYNTDGSIDSRVKASDTTGFSVVSYDGSSSAGTIGHGLSSAPDFIVVKNRDAGFSWTCYHSGLDATAPEDYYIQLDNTGARTSTTDWNSTAPTSSVFSVNGAEGRINRINERFIAYCWSETTGYSKFGSYTGNGSTDGPEVTCGFKPAFVIVKRTDSASGNGWYIWDGTRSTTNPIHNTLIANLSGAEDSTSEDVNFLSDGFKLLRTYGDFNASGGTYIYAAFADTREAAFWLDQSGNDNDWQPVNLDHNDTVADSPTNNFATWNPLIAGTGTFADGNLSVTTTVDKATSGTILSSSGQHYCEIICTSATTIANARLGVVNDSGIGTALGGNANTWAYLADGRVYHNNSSSSYGTTLAVGDVFQIALDIDAGKVWYGINGTWMASGDPSTGANPSQTFTANQSMTFAVASGSGTFTFVANFGQQPFKYDPPE